MGESSGLLCLLLLSACDNYPKDVENSLAKIHERGEIRVGLVEEPPWVERVGETPGGTEVELIKQFAAELGVEPEFIFLSEARVSESLKNYELDIAAGGFTMANPRTEISFTRPYHVTGDEAKHQHVFALPQGENALQVALEKFLGPPPSSASDGM